MSSSLSLVTAPAPHRSPRVALTPVARAGSRVVILVDSTGASVAAELPFQEYHRMSPSLRDVIDGRPHIQTWCNRHGRVDVPATLLAAPVHRAARRARRLTIA